MVERKTLNLVVVGSSPTEGVFCIRVAALAQLGERQTEDLKVPGSIPGLGIFFFSICEIFRREVLVFFEKFGFGEMGIWLIQCNTDNIL